MVRNWIKTNRLVYRTICVALVVGQFFATPVFLFAEKVPVFVEQQASKTSLYVGEQTLYSFDLNTQTTVFNYQPPEFSLNDVWSEVIAVNQRYRRTIRGEGWNTYSTRRAIYPLKPGKMTLPAVTVPVTVRLRTQRRMPVPFGFEDAFDDDLIDQFFGEVEQREIELQADALELDVKPLPLPPPDLQSSHIPVGATHLTARTSRDSLKAGENLTLEVTVVSVGNLNPLTELPLKVPAGVRIYPEAPKTTQNENNNALIMRKTFRYSLLPIGGGTYLIPAIKLPYFDTDTGSYRVAESRDFSFFSEGAAAEPAAPAVTETAQPESAPTIAQTTPVSPINGEPESRWDSVDPETLLYLAVSALLFSIVVVFGWIRIRANRSTRTMRKRLMNAESLDQLSHRFRTALLSALRLPESQYSYEELCVLLKKRAFSSEVEFLTLSLLDTLEQNRFSAPQGSEDTLQKLKQETIKAISAILNESRKKVTDGNS